MAVPRYVPSPVRKIKHYRSSKKMKHDSGVKRPAEIYVDQSEYAGTGNPGPEQGYALKLVKGFKDEVHLLPKERWEDAADVAVIVALKRASLFGRAPCHHDLAAGFLVWGYADPQPDEILVGIRKDQFSHIGSSHNYSKRRKIADAVVSAGLHQPLDLIVRDYESDWGSLINLALLQES